MCLILADGNHGGPQRWVHAYHYGKDGKFKTTDFYAIPWMSNKSPDPGVDY